MISVAPRESYERLGRRWWRATRARPRGFRLVCARNRFLVRRLRTKLLTFLGLVGRYARLLARRLSASSTGGGLFPRSGSARAQLVKEIGKDGRAPQRCSRPAGEAAPRRAASFMRSNSFYAQAIADCLEFIKRNSVPEEDYGGVVVVGAGAGR